MSFALGVAIFATNMYVRMDDGRIVSFEAEKVKEVFFGEDSELLPSDSIPADTIAVDSLANKLKYKVSGSSATVIGCYDKDKISGEIVIPEYVEIDGAEYKVVGIDQGAFSYIKNPFSVVLPKSVAYIGDGAFYYSSGLTDVNVPYGVASIESYAFAECTGLTSLTLPYSVASVGVHGFENCVNLDLVIDSWYGRVFTSPYAMSNVKSILYLRADPAEDPTIVDAKDYYLSFEVTSDSTVEVTWSVYSELTSVTIPEKVLLNSNVYTVTGVSSAAFAENTNLKEINIPSTVTYISQSAFHGCTGLTNVTIPSSVVDLGAGAFYECENLDVVIENSEDNIKYDKVNTFYGCKSLTFIPQ